MALQATNLDAGSSTTTGSLTTNSFTPGANKLILFTIWEVDSTPGTISSITGNGITWTQVATANIPVQSRITMWRGLSNSPTTGAITVNFSGDNTPHRLWVVDQISGIDPSGASGANAVVQSATNTANGTNSSIAVTLGAFSSSNNATYGVMGRDATNAITPGGSFSEVAQVNALSRRMESQFATSNQTSVPWTFGSASGDIEAVGIELKALLAGGSFLSHFL